MGRSRWRSRVRCRSWARLASSSTSSSAGWPVSTMDTMRRSCESMQDSSRSSSSAAGFRCWASSTLFQEEVPELIEQLDLLGAVVRDAELRQQRLQQLDVAQRRVDEPSRNVLRAEFPQGRIEHGGLAGADLAGDHDEAVVVHQREAHVGRARV